MRSALIKLFSGEIHIKDTAYFFVHGAWQSLTFDYVAFIHWQFRELMRECLLDANDIRTLKRPWEGKESEDSYNTAYILEPDMLIGDKVLAENNVELFDILQMTKKEAISRKMVWHCVKSGFQQQMRDLASQVRVSASVAHALASSSQAIPPWFDQFCHELHVKNINYGGINKIGGKEANNLLAIAKRQLTIVCDVCDTANRNVLEDCFKQNAIHENDLGFFKGLSVRTKLIETEYLTSDGHPTPKFRGVTKEKFKAEVSTTLFCTKKDASDIYTKIKKLTMPSFGSLIAPLELVKLRRQVTKKGFGFKLHFIPEASDPRGKEYKDYAFASQFAKLLTMDIALHAGSQVTFKQQEFVLYNASDDNASALHAAFGTFENGKFFYPGGEKLARTNFAKALCSCINTKPRHPQVIKLYTEQIRTTHRSFEQMEHGRAFALKLGQDDKSKKTSTGF